MAFSEIKFKTNGRKGSPFYKTFLKQNISDKCLSIRSVLRTVPADSLNCVNGTVQYIIRRKVITKFAPRSLIDT